MARTQSRDVPRSGMQACEVRRGGHRDTRLLIEGCRSQALLRSRSSRSIDVPTRLAPALIMMIFADGRGLLMAARGAVLSIARAVQSARAGSVVSLRPFVTSS
ncbi:hypothetical protein A1D31_05670 [Bradyrhizobium liaoningense]|nr:hypothetical protein A1D31_05670 [Bradyrhizobium liaoningense]